MQGGGGGVGAGEVTGGLRSTGSQESLWNGPRAGQGCFRSGGGGGGGGVAGAVRNAVGKGLQDGSERLLSCTNVGGVLLGNGGEQPDRRQCILGGGNCHLEAGGSSSYAG